MDISCEHYIFRAKTACPQETMKYTVHLCSRWMCKEAWKLFFGWPDRPPFCSDLDILFICIPQTQSHISQSELLMQIVFVWGFPGVAAFSYHIVLCTLTLHCRITRVLKGQSRQKWQFYHLFIFISIQTCTEAYVHHGIQYIATVSSPMHVCISQFRLFFSEFLIYILEFWYSSQNCFIIIITFFRHLTTCSCWILRSLYFWGGQKVRIARLKKRSNAHYTYIFFGWNRLNYFLLERDKKTCFGGCWKTKSIDFQQTHWLDKTKMKYLFYISKKKDVSVSK